MSLYEAQAGPSKPRAQSSSDNKAEKSSVSASSFLGLKADLAQRQDELKRRTAGSDRADSTTSSRRLPSYLRPDSSVARSKHAKASSGSGRSTSAWASTPSAQLDAARAALEKKALIYEKLKKGKHAGLDEGMLADTLVDWERRAEEESSDEDESEEGTTGEREADEEDPLIEYVDEFGRSRMLPRSEVPRDWLRAREREQQREDEGYDDDEAIYGPATSFPVYRPPSPRRASPSAPFKRFDARHEVRAKGAGFYQFSANEGKRRKEMEQLMEIRRETERLRRERSGDPGSEDEERQEQRGKKTPAQQRLDERRKVVEAKRQEILARRAARNRPASDSTPLEATATRM